MGVIGRSEKSHQPEMTEGPGDKVYAGLWALLLLMGSLEVGGGQVRAWLSHVIKVSQPISNNVWEFCLQKISPSASLLPSTSANFRGQS